MKVFFCACNRIGGHKGLTIALIKPETTEQTNATPTRDGPDRRTSQVRPPSGPHGPHAGPSEHCSRQCSLQCTEPNAKAPARFSFTELHLAATLCARARSCDLSRSNGIPSLQLVPHTLMSWFMRRRAGGRLLVQLYRPFARSVLKNQSLHMRLMRVSTPVTGFSPSAIVHRYVR